MDGKLDEKFWTAYNYPRPLREFRTKAKPKDAARFMGRWWNGGLYFGIRCEFDPDRPPIIGSTKNQDPAIWQGEHLELLIETDKHSYYQIVLNPAGAIIDLDRGVTVNVGTIEGGEILPDRTAHPLRVQPIDLRSLDPLEAAGIGLDHRGVELELAMRNVFRHVIHRADVVP